MTTQELDKLIYDAESGDAESLVSACDLLLNDYIKFRIKNVIQTCHIQLLKLNWTLIEKIAPELLVIEPTIKDRFIETKSAPTVNKLKELFKYVIQNIQNHKTDSEFLQKLSIVFNRFGSLLLTILNLHFKEYANDPKVVTIVSNYNREPSFHSYASFVKDFLNLSSEFNESERANRYFSTILINWSSIENSPKVESLKSRCKDLALLLDRDAELRFAKIKYGADNGCVEDIAGLGILYEQGIGVATDDTIAKLLYMQAMNAGYKDAQVYLDNLNSRIQQQEEQKLEQIRIQNQHEIQKKEQELRQQETQQRFQLERLRLYEEKRHNEQLEDAEQQKIDVAREKLSQDKELELIKLEAVREQQLREEEDRETQAEEKMIDVIFTYDVRWKDGSKRDRCRMYRTIPSSTYQCLLTGGTNSINNYVAGEKEYRSIGESIQNATMTLY